MNYDFDINNFTRIINSAVVPADDHGGLDLELGDTDINIKKPYLDAEGTNMGNSIFISAPNGLTVYMRIESGFLFTFYRENEQGSFKSLEAGSPESIKTFTWKIWTQIVDYIEHQEKADVQFQNQFSIYGVPYDLERLLEFEKEYGRGTYADGFYLDVIDKTGLRTYAEEESFLHAFIEFAQANASGSTYAIWVINEKLDRCPIVVFGDEGGIHLVAKNTEEFIRLLSYDVEITVGWESAYFYKSENNSDESEHKSIFLQWIKTVIGVTPITTDQEADLIIRAANDQFADSLYDFLIKYDIDVEQGFENLLEYRTLKAFQNNFRNRTLPKELAMLFDFQQNHPNYAQYFLLRGYGPSVLKKWKQDEQFQNAMIPFARATSFGAIYALWDEGKEKETKDMPVLVLDEENGISVIAEHVLQLFRLLTYDIEPILDGETVKLSNDRDNYATSNHTENYINWLQANFGISPTEAPYEDVIDKAEEKYTDAFWHWETSLK